MCSHDSGMTLLGKGCTQWGFLIILFVAATSAPSTCHPVNNTQSDDTALYDDIFTYDDTIASDDTFTSYDYHDFFTQSPEDLDAIQLHTDPTVAYQESTLQDDVTGEDTPTTVRSFVENEDASPLEARNRALDVNVAVSAPSLDETPQETKMEEVLDLLEVDFLNPHDPAFEHPGALRMVTHTGDHLQVTKDHNGSISVNGSLVDGVMTLPDGTEIYTLEKFLEQHRDQMDKAFKVLAAQSKSLRQRSGRNFVTTKSIENMRLEEIQNSTEIDEPTLVEPEKPTILPFSENQVTEIDSLVTPDAISINETTAGNEYAEFASNTEVTTLELLSDDNQLNLATPDPESTEPHTDNSALEFTESVTSLEDIVTSVPKLALTNDTALSTKLNFGSGLFAFATDNSTGVYLEELTPVTEHLTELNIDYEEFPVTEPLQTVNLDEKLDLVTEHFIEATMDDQTLSVNEHLTIINLREGDVPVIKPQTEANLNNQATQYNEDSLKADLDTDHTPVSEQVIEFPPVTEHNLRSDLVTDQALTLEDVAEATPERFTTAELETETLHFFEHSTELGPKEVHFSLNRTLVDFDDFHLVTELGPVAGEGISESPGNPNANTEEPSPVTHETVTEFGSDIIVDSIPITEISFKTSVDFVIRTEIPQVIRVKPQIIAGGNSSNDVSDSENWTFLPEPTSHNTSKDSPHEFQEVNHDEDEFRTSVFENVPPISPVIEEANASSLLDIWRLAVANQSSANFSIKDNRVPSTILSPDESILMDLKSKGILSPLYEESPEKVALRTEILLDYLLEEPVLPNDPRMTLPDALNATNFGGKMLSFRQDPNGLFSVNGIPVLNFRALKDGTEVYTIATFLFDHISLLEAASHKPSSISDENIPTVSTTFLVDTGELQTVEMSTETFTQVEVPVTEVLENEPLRVVPRMPESLTRELSSLVDIWQYAVPNEKSGEEVSNLPLPKTVISPAHNIIRDLIPRNTPHPLFDETSENVELRRLFLLDYLIREIVNESDPKVYRAEGLLVTNLNGNTLQFKKDDNDKLTINGLVVLNSEVLSDGTINFVLDGLLFNHQTLVDQAFDRLLAQTRSSGFGDLGNPTGIGNDVQAVPSIPLSVDSEKASSLIHLWRHALRNQESLATLEGLQEPKTVLSPSYMKLLSIFPAEGPDPLYCQSSENVLLRSEILLDYLVLENVNSEDPKMSEPAGLSVSNLNGKNLVFINSNGNITVNGISAISEVLSDGTQIYDLEDFLFDHKEKIDAAFRKLTKQSCTLEPMAIPSVCVTPVKDSFGPIPNIPQRLEEVHGSSLLYLWHFALNNQEVPGDSTPVTVLYPEYKILVNLVPPDALQPLYDQNPENVEFRSEFLLDYLVMEPVDFEDPKLSLPEGISVQNLNGKELVFKKYSEGNITVNGVAVNSKEHLSDGVWTYGLVNFLFDHRPRLDQAFDNMFGYSSGSDDLSKIGDPFSRSNSPEEDLYLHDVVVTLPQKLINEPSLTMYHLWQRALDVQDSLGILRCEKEPRTILSPPMHKVTAFAPFGIPHPLSDNANEANVVLRREIVNDYLLMNFVSPLDRRMDDPDGVVFKNFNGKPIVFKKLSKGNHTINGENVELSEGVVSVNDVLVEAIHSARGYVIYSIKDFLFDHEERVHKAVGELKASLLERHSPVPGGVEFVIARTPSPMSYEATPYPVPAIPRIIEGGKLTKLINLWRHALDNQDFLMTLNDDRVPRTILSPGYTAMNLVPPGAPHPLFDSRTNENAVLRNEIVLDYLILPRVSEAYLETDSESDDGYSAYSIRNLNGKILHFSKSPAGKYFINGIGVESTLDLPDGTMVYFLEDFLFDHRERVNRAFEKLVQQRLSQIPIDGSLDTSMLPEIRETIPKIPDSVIREQATTLIDIWRIALKHQNPRRTEEEKTVPRTVISPVYTALVNLFPLVDETNAALRAQFLLDYLSVEPVSMYDPKMAMSTGLTVLSLNGRELVFRRDNDGITINGIPATKDKTLEDGTEVYTITELLFEHRLRIDHAFEIMKSQASESDLDTGTNTDKSASISPFDEEIGTVPGIPEIVKMSNLPSFLDIWHEAVAYQGPSATARDGRIPRTILSPHYQTLLELLPPVLPNPFFDNSVKSALLRVEFLRDYLVLPPIDVSDTLLGELEGQNYINLNGKAITVFKNTKGDLFINSVAVENVHPLRDGTLVVVLKDLLFDHAKLIKEALADVPNVFRASANVPGTDTDELIKEETVTPKRIPAIPETVELGKHSSLLRFWQRALEDQQGQSVAVNPVLPQTVLNPNSEVLMNLVPPDFLHPLLSDTEESIALRTEILLDYLLPQLVHPQDDSMDTPDGLSVKNFFGKSLIFKGKFSAGTVEPKTKLTVNGVQVIKVTTLPGGTQLFELADLLFDHRKRILDAFREIKNTPAANIEEYAQSDANVETIDSGVLKEPTRIVPAVPQPVSLTRSPSLYHLWAYNQVHQEKFRTDDGGPSPRTILSPNRKVMEALIPASEDHPIYNNSLQRNVNIRVELLLNYLVLEMIDERDTRITQPGGLTVQNLLGNDVTFMINNEGNFVANGVMVEKIENLDNIKVYHLADFLFDHLDIRALNEDYKNPFSMSGASVLPAVSADSDMALQVEQHLAKIVIHDVAETPQLNLDSIPGIPRVVENSGSSLVSLWRHALRHQDSTVIHKDKRIPMTILSPISDKMRNMVPMDAPHPLYDESPENVALRREFLLDSLILEPISAQDTQITQPGGLVVSNLAGKTLTFATDADGNLMVGGVPVEDVQTLSDGTQIYTLSSFLFSHKAQVDEALHKLAGYEGDFSG